MKRLLYLILLLSPVALAGGGQPQPITVKLDSGASCHPHVGAVKFGFTPDAEASKRMAEIFTADQAARQPGVGAIDWSKVAAEDEQRRKDTLALLKAGRLSSGIDYFNAAFVFQHGDCPQHYRLANLLAAEAIKRDDPQARWIYAATYDRWQRSLGKPQKYGTQYSSVGGNCQFKLDEYDPHTTDFERSKYDVPPLAEALARADQINADCRARQP